MKIYNSLKFLKLNFVAVSTLSSSINKLFSWGVFKTSKEWSKF